MIHYRCIATTVFQVTENQMILRDLSEVHHGQTSFHDHFPISRDAWMICGVSKFDNTGLGHHMPLVHPKTLKMFFTPN